MAKKKKKTKREPGSKITYKEFDDMVLILYKSFECERNVIIDNVKLDFYFPDISIGITYDKLSANDVGYLKYAKDIWIVDVTPYEIVGEDVEFEWTNS